MCHLTRMNVPNGKNRPSYQFLMPLIFLLLLGSQNSRWISRAYQQQEEVLQ